MVANRRERQITVADSVHLTVGDPGTLRYLQSFLTEDANDASTPAHHVLLRELHEQPGGLQARKFGSLLDCTPGSSMFSGYLRSGSFRVTYAEASRFAFSDLSQEDIKAEFAGKVFADLAENWLITRELPQGDILLTEEKVLRLSHELYPGSTVVDKVYQKPHLHGNGNGRTYVADAIGVRMVDGDPRISNVYEYSAADAENEKYNDQYKCFVKMKSKYPSLFLPESESGTGTKFVILVPSAKEEGGENSEVQETQENRDILPGENDVAVIYLPFTRTRFSQFTRYLLHSYQPYVGSRDKKGKIIPSSGSATLHDLWKEGRVQRATRVTVVDFSLEESLQRMGITLPSEVPLDEVA